MEREKAHTLRLTTVLDQKFLMAKILQTFGDPDHSLHGGGQGAFPTRKNMGQAQLTFDVLTTSVDVGMFAGFVARGLHIVGRVS